MHRLESRLVWLGDRLCPYLRTRWALWLTGLLLLAHLALQSDSVLSLFIVGFYLLQLALGYCTPRGLGEQEQGGGGDGEETDTLTREEHEYKVWSRATAIQLVAHSLQWLGVLTMQVFWPLLVAYLVGSAVWVVFRLDFRMRKYKYSPQSFVSKAGQV